MVERVDIVIPTLKDRNELQEQITAIEDTAEIMNRLIVTCQKESAPVNRNIGLSLATTPIIIMLDDDMTGFFPGWDRELIKPLLMYDDVPMVSARLIRENGSIPSTCANNTDISQDYVLVNVRKDSVMASACIAFKDMGLRFDEGFIGSGWEDTDFGFQYMEKMPDCKFFINNKCKLVHLNEMKNQYNKTPEGTYFQINKRFFYKKWNVQ